MIILRVSANGYRFCMAAMLCVSANIVVRFPFVLWSYAESVRYQAVQPACASRCFIHCSMLSFIISHQYSEAWEQTVFQF
jgi:hypothetical protein